MIKLSEHKIALFLKKIFYKKFNMYIGIYFEDTFDTTQQLKIIIFNSDFNQSGYKYLLALLQPYLIPVDSDTLDQINIDLTKITWDELIAIIRLI